MKAKSLLAGAVAALFMGGAQAYTIDAFTDAQIVVDNAAGNTNDAGDSTTSNVGPSANIIGGYRVVEVNATMNSSATSKDATVNIGGGELSFSTGSGLRGYSVITWNGTNTAGSTAGLGAINLTQYGNAFLTETRDNDLGFKFSIQVWSNGGAKSSRIVLDSTTTPDYMNPGILDAIPFFAFGLCGTFATCTGGGADFTQVSALQLVLNYENLLDPNNGTQRLDLAIGPIGTTPEPGVLALFGAAALAGAVSVRRRRQSK